MLMRMVEWAEVEELLEVLTEEQEEASGEELEEV